MRNTIKIDRQKLYDEIWEISASGIRLDRLGGASL